MEGLNSLNVLEAEIIKCDLCPRLVSWREEIARQKRRAFRGWDYWGKPVPGFGDPKARVLVVGLAPGAHGSNRTGRMFTGDSSGDFLYKGLFKAGFASHPKSSDRRDGLKLVDLFISAVCRCAPPANMPTRAEMDNCHPYLAREIELIQPQVYVALGRIAFERLLLKFLFKPISHKFRHGGIITLDNNQVIVCSYHPSRQNTQTGRLTLEMFDQIWETVGKLLQGAGVDGINS